MAREISEEYRLGSLDRSALDFNQHTIRAISTRGGANRPRLPHLRKK
jgi:hypothetical protein